ncbi:hypothetical protein [Nocardia sp. CY41]|uniref:hypothetical protein n=1 Tax=Nocardia sp. CY41 TaxID=2608686 RepID=UPI00135A9CEE|nr:hypothetical protein [Nocardia sp. CY41]
MAAGTNEFEPVPGLRYLPAWLDDAEQAALLDAIDAAPWSAELRAGCSTTAIATTTAAVPSRAELALIPHPRCRIGRA